MLSLTPSRQLHRQMALDATMALFFVSVVLGEPRVGRVLRSPPLLFLDGVSYPLYLLHGTVLVVLFHRIPGFGAILRDLAGGSTWGASLAYAACVLSIASLAAWALRVLVEERFSGTIVGTAERAVPAKEPRATALCGCVYLVIGSSS